jgi:hypothetical protein
MNKHQAIFSLYSNVVTIRGDDAFDVNENPVQYDEAVVQNYMNANAYKESRAREYPALEAQFDLLYHGGMDAWKTAIQAVKDKYPKV